MRSVLRLVPTRLCLLPLLLALAPGCAGTVSIATTGSACSELLPAEWRKPVPGAPLPEGDSVGDWVAFGDGQTAQLDKANDRTGAAIGIVERCEKRDREAVDRARKPWWKIF